MRGYKGHNFKAFDRATMLLRRHGFQVISPADMDRDIGVTERTKKFPKGFARQAMRRDLTAILRRCNLLVALEGWEKSTGAVAEVKTAISVHIPVLEAIIRGKHLALIPIKVHKYGDVDE